MMNSSSPNKNGLYLVHLSIHGLVRSKDIELGINADTGGQVKYVVELVKELGTRDNIWMVDLITRRVCCDTLSNVYSEKYEKIEDKARIVRLNFGPDGYVVKENLWPHIDELVNECLKHFKEIGRNPDIIHAHYADAGCVGSILSKILNVPLVFTGHSLGRIKLSSLYNEGMTEEEADFKYNIRKRITAEESTLSKVSLIVASTKQEELEQYSKYENISQKTIKVIPPGIDFACQYSQKKIVQNLPRVMSNLKRFLVDVRKPVVLAVARADEKKNLPSLVLAFARDDFLRRNANLIILAGQRTKLKSLEAGARKVWMELLKIIDDEELYGIVAYPKRHRHDDIPTYMAYARSTKGVFVNSALNEPFGLTLLEAGVAGLPVVSTKNGGPSDILSKIGHGLLVDPTNLKEISGAIKKIIVDKTMWTSFSEAGKKVVEHYSWTRHVSTYLHFIQSLALKIYNHDSSLK